MFERLDLSNDLGWIGFKIVNMTRTNIYKDLDLFEKRSGSVFDEMMNSILFLNNLDKKIKTKPDELVVQKVFNKPNSSNNMPMSTDISRFTLNREPKGVDCSRCVTWLGFDYDEGWPFTVKVWSKTYCQACWSNLICKSCGDDIDKKKAFKGKDDHIYCENCIVDNLVVQNSSKLKTKQDELVVQKSQVPNKPNTGNKRIGTDISRFTLNENPKDVRDCSKCNKSFYQDWYDYNNTLVDYEYLKKNCGKLELCEILRNNKTYSNKSVTVWSKTYCVACWSNLVCKNCGGDIDKINAFKGKDNQIFCENCIKENSKFCILV